MSQTPSLYKHSLTHTVGSYLKQIAVDFMKHIRMRMKYPCVLLFHIPAALRVYRLMHSLEKQKLIHRLEENDGRLYAKCCGARSVRRQVTSEKKWNMLH